MAATSEPLHLQKVIGLKLLLAKVEDMLLEGGDEVEQQLRDILAECEVMRDEAKALEVLLFPQYGECTREHTDPCTVLIRTFNFLGYFRPSPVLVVVDC